MSKEDEVDVSIEQAKLVATVRTRSTRQAEAAAEAADAVVEVEEDSCGYEKNSYDND